MRSLRTALSGALGALAASALAASAVAQPSSLRDQLFGAPSDGRRGAMPSVARFIPDDGEPFILDRSAGGQVLLRFETSPEIWALTPTPGPRGDVIYKNDMGETVLRATRLGGVTLFTPDRPSGVAAALVGPGAMLRPSPILSTNALLQIFLQSSARAGRAAGHAMSFEFEADSPPPTATTLVADAATVVAEAFVGIARTGERGRRTLAKFVKVRFELGGAPATIARGDTLRVIIAPERGLAGRPSSHRIEAALKR